MLQALTLKIAALLHWQESIVDWLESVMEDRAAKWFLATWTGEHGNYTNTSAGYVGTADANGPESGWIYLKRDTIGQAGTNMCMPLSVFVPSVEKYLTNFSMRHADGLLN